MLNQKLPSNTISLQLESLNRLSSAIISDLSLNKVLDITVKELRRIFGIRICGIFLPDEKGILKMIKYSGVSKRFQDYFNRNINPRINKNILRILRPRYTNDVLNFYRDNKFLHALVKIGKFRKEISVPLKLKNQIIGVLNLGRYAKEKDFTAQDLALVSILANHVTIAINNVKLYEKMMNYTRTLEEQNKDLNTILKVSQATSRTLDLDKILKVATEKIAKALKVGRCTATLGTPSEAVGTLRGIYSCAVNEVSRIGMKLYLKDVPFLQKAIRRREYLFAPNIDDYPTTGYLKKHFHKAKTKSVLFIPVVVGKKIIGVFTISSLEKPRIFSPREIKLAQTIANQVAVAIENARLMNLVKEHSQHLAILSSKVIKAQEEERKRIAEELHDRVGQALTAMKINLQMSNHNLPTNAKQVKDRIADTQQLLSETLEEIRYLSSDLRPPTLDDFGLVPTIRWYGQSFSKRFDINFNLRIDGFGRLPSETETIMYRLAQEALTNVGKHSKAKDVWVSLSCNESNAYMTIRDNGIGFDVGELYAEDYTKKSFGLMSMRERVQLLNGSFNIKSKKNYGTKLIITIPLTQDEKNKSSHSR
ncbi:MAG: GAF domain-containing sensor histidine kinase [candidate division Zixibacteria bacterium]|nr:GAF domain-containing sensor histidine kinase [candidate division Zixibacteria bacterium]